MVKDSDAANDAAMNNVTEEQDMEVGRRERIGAGDVEQQYDVATDAAEKKAKKKHASDEQRSHVMHKSSKHHHHSQHHRNHRHHRRHGSDPGRPCIATRRRRDASYIVHLGFNW